MTSERPWPTDDEVLHATKSWLERAVIGLSLCPFAKAVHVRDQIRYVVSSAETCEALLDELRHELRALSQTDPDIVDTTLLIAPRVLGDFLDYNDFLAVAEDELERLGFSGELQIASFHPDYQFGDSTPDDIANYTNRSPYPILHLLREESVSRAVDAFPDASQIYEKNIRTLRALGKAGWERTLHGRGELGRATPSTPNGSESNIDPRLAGTFAELRLSAELLAVLARLGFERPTPIQAQCIPPLLAGRDIVGQSRTGSGKTLAFAVPVLERLNVSRREVQALILCPTRELSAQVARELRKVGRYRAGLSVSVLTGGEPVKAQTGTLDGGAHIVVGTPGRVLDHLRRRTLRVHGVQSVVLDEADRMLDMGFQPDIEKILHALPSKRQTVFFSATIPPAVRELCARYQQPDPIWVRTQDDAASTADIRQHVVRVDASQKLETLIAALEEYTHDSALVFANQKVSVGEIEAALREAGFSVDSLHGDLEQRDRDRVMAKFRNGSVRVLVATDVAARGIDLDRLDLVINFDFPDRAESYVHRIGRTGRAGKLGVAISFLAPGEEGALAAVERLTGSSSMTPAEQSRMTAPSAAPQRAAVTPPAAEMDTLRISGGRKDKLRPGDILGALTGEAGGLRSEDVGKIEIHDRFSFVAVTRAASRAALKSLRDGRIKGRRFRVQRVE